MSEKSHIIPPARLATWITRLRAVEPHAVAILCHGSYARGTPEPYSDLDLDLLIESHPDVAYRSAFEELPDRQLLHATIATINLGEWLAQFDEPQESEAWAFFLPARQVAVLLWATSEATQQLEGKLTIEFRMSPQLQDLLESAAKVRNAILRHDELAVRLAAQDVALRCPALLGILQEPAPVNSRVEALQTALTMPIAPAHYREDMLVCLGMSGRATAINTVHNAALRLTTGIIALLRANIDRAAGFIEPGLPEALQAGRVDQVVGTAAIAITSNAPADDSDKTLAADLAE